MQQTSRPPLASDEYMYTVSRGTREQHLLISQLIPVCFANASNSKRYNTIETQRDSFDPLPTCTSKSWKKPWPGDTPEPKGRSCRISETALTRSRIAQLAGGFMLCKEKIEGLEIVVGVNGAEK